MSEKRVPRVLRVMVEGPAAKVQEEIILLENRRPHDWAVEMETEEVEEDGEA